MTDEIQPIFSSADAFQPCFDNHEGRFASGILSQTSWAHDSSNAGKGAMLNVIASRWPSAGCIIAATKTEYCVSTYSA
jgi:hypothetical protein